MQQTGKIWMNGRLVPFKDAKVHVLTHGLHYSTAVFEGIRCYNTAIGPAIFRLPEHVDRLFLSAKMYSMRMGYTKRQAAEAIKRTVRANKFKECYIRPIAYHGFGTMGLSPPAKKVDLSISCWKWNNGESTAGMKTGAKCMVSSWAKIDSRFQPMKAKGAANYTNAGLARQEASEGGFDEAIMLNTDGRVAEGSAEHIFIVKDGQIITPPLSSGLLEGITRASVIEIIEKDGGSVVEADFGREDLYGADEAFMTGTAAEVRAIVQVDRIRVGSGKMGSQTRALQKAYGAAIRGKDERFLGWLHPV